jgi:hypothetical protein
VLIRWVRSDSDGLIAKVTADLLNANNAQKGNTHFIYDGDDLLLPALGSTSCRCKCVDEACILDLKFQDFPSKLCLTSSTTFCTPLISCANLPKNMPSTYWPKPFPPFVLPLQRPGPALPP